MSDYYRPVRRDWCCYVLTRQTTTFFQQQIQLTRICCEEWELWLQHWDYIVYVQWCLAPGCCARWKRVVNATPRYPWEKEINSIKQRNSNNNNNMIVEVKIFKRGHMYLNILMTTTTMMMMMMVIIILIIMCLLFLLSLSSIYKQKAHCFLYLSITPLNFIRGVAVCVDKSLAWRFAPLTSTPPPPKKETHLHHQK